MQTPQAAKITVNPLSVCGEKSSEFHKRQSVTMHQKNLSQTRNNLMMLHH